MSTAERVIQIAGNGFDMLGIVSLPAPNAAMQSTGMVIVVGGAQYRVGSHRQFVQLARHVAAAGFPVLRFDLPGMGDSPGEVVSFEETAPHIAAAIDALQAELPLVKRVVLWGLCDGASANLLYTQISQDPRVTGLALLNPWVRSEIGLARAHVKHYYRQRLLEPEFWRKLLTGRVGWEALSGLITKLRLMRPSGPPAATSFRDRMADGWRNFPGQLLLMLSELDLTAQEFSDHVQTNPCWNGALDGSNLTQHRLPRADHTCSTEGSASQVEAHTLHWLRLIGETNAH